MKQSQIIQRELISKDKWKSDKEITKCYRCDKQFNVLIRRKHHCRRCGNIFCQDCSNYFLEGHQNNLEKKVRFCMKCYDYIKQLISAKGFFVEKNDEQNIQFSIKIENASHSRNQSKQFDLSSTFVSSKSVIAKPYEGENSQDEDDTIQENHQDVAQFLEESDNEKGSSNKLILLKEKNAQQLEKICEYLLQNVLQNNKCYEKAIEQWKVKLKALIITCVQEVYFLSFFSEIMDINYYLKIKILPQVEEQLTSVFCGLIFRKNVALKHMKTEIINPVIIILKGDFDMEKEKEKEQVQFQDFLQYEQKYIIEKINKIQQHFKVNVIFVEKNANKIALDECLKKQITVLTNVKEKVLKRIKLCTNAKQIKLSRLEDYIDKKVDISGKAYKMFFRSFPKQKLDKQENEIESKKDQTFCFLQIQDKKFATVVLSGSSEEILKKCKSCFQGCVRYGRHQDLECHMIVTETSMLQNNYFQNKIMSQCGNFTNFLYEKVCLKELIAKNECKYVKINYVLADPSSIYDVKDLSSIEDYKQRHQRYSDKLEEFSIAKICNKPMSKKTTYYGSEDVCLGQFIFLKISNKDKKCEDCHLPKNAHISLYYCGNKFIKISVDQKFRSGRIVSTNEPPVLQAQISQSSQFSQLSNEDEQNANSCYKAKDIGKILAQNHQDQNGQKSKVKLETYIQCRRCDYQTSIEKLSPQNLEFSLFRYFQTLLLSQSTTGLEKSDQQNVCNHQFQRIFTYQESMVKLLVGEIDVYASVKLSYQDSETLETLKKWEENYFIEQKKELFRKFQNIGQQLIQIKQNKCKNLQIENNLFDDNKISQLQQQIVTLEQLWLFVHQFSVELQEIYDRIKYELKKHSNPLKHWDHSSKTSIVQSQKDLDFASRSLVIQVENKGHLSGQDNDLLIQNSDCIADLGDLDCIQENKSPLGGKASKSPQLYQSNAQHSVKDLDTIHIPQQEKSATPELELLKEWPQCIFRTEQSRITNLQPKLFSFVPIYENSSLSSIAFVLNHPVYLKSINYFENFIKNESDSKQNLSKLLLTKTRQFIDKIENEESSLPRESCVIQSDTNSINQGKKEKNYLTIQLQYDKQKSLKPSMSRDGLSLQLDDEKSITSSQQSSIGSSHQQQSQQQQQQQLVKKSRTYDVLVYFPIQFEALRQACGINTNQFIISLCTTMQWNASGGKSSSMFFKSQDELFVIKKFEDDKEFRMFEQFALDYFRHMHRHLFETQKASLLCKIFGMYEIRDKGNSEYYIVMQNLYYGMGNLKDLLVYDLKGSELNRWEKKVNKVLLDTNFILDRNSEPIVLQTEQFNYNDKAFQADCKFLNKKEIVDYSLLLIIDNKQKKIRIGIIDYFRFFTWDKQTEGFLKYVLKGGKVPTITNPNDYKERFIKAMERYFIHA